MHGFIIFLRKSYNRFLLFLCLLMFIKKSEQPLWGVIFLTCVWTDVILHFKQTECWFFKCLKLNPLDVIVLIAFNTRSVHVLHFVPVVWYGFKLILSYCEYPCSLLCVFGDFVFLCAFYRSDVSNINSLSIDFKQHRLYFMFYKWQFHIWGACIYKRLCDEQ